MRNKSNLKKLSRSRLLKIRSIAEQKLSDFGYTGGYVNIVKFAESIGATVKSSRYDNGDLAGMLVREKNKTPLIIVNSAHHVNRRRFTIAHECGHLLLHKSERLFIDEKLSIQKRDETSSLAISSDEIEANQFAAEVLMPLRYVWRDISRLDFDIEDDTDTLILAKKYKVSVQAMSFRVYNISSEKLFS